MDIGVRGKGGPNALKHVETEQNYGRDIATTLLRTTAESHALGTTLK